MSADNTTVYNGSCGLENTHVAFSTQKDAAVCLWVPIPAGSTLSLWIQRREHSLHHESSGRPHQSLRHRSQQPCSQVESLSFIFRKTLAECSVDFFVPRGHGGEPAMDLLPLLDSHQRLASPRDHRRDARHRRHRAAGLTVEVFRRSYIVSAFSTGELFATRRRSKIFDAFHVVGASSSRAIIP